MPLLSAQQQTRLEEGDPVPLAHKHMCKHTDTRRPPFLGAGWKKLTFGVSVLILKK